MKGNINLQALHNGNDLLGKYRSTEVMKDQPMDLSLTPDAWMKKLLSSEDSGIGLGTDPIVELVTTMFTGLMALAMQIDGQQKSQEEQMQKSTEACLKRQVDLTSLVPSMKECVLNVQDNGKLSLDMNDGKERFTHELSSAETNRLQRTLGDTTLSDTEKKQRVASLVNNVMLSHQVSQNFEQGVNAGQSQSEDLYDEIVGEMTFRGKIGKEVDYKQDKKGNPFIAFSAFSTEKVDDSFNYTWVRFIRFSGVKEEYLQPKRKINVKGLLDLSAYNGRINIACRVSEMSEHIPPQCNNYHQ